jgi:hypothetical protein
MAQRPSLQNQEEITESNILASAILLTERVFQIRVNNDVSNIHNIKSGVPQGSVLDPFLYLLYTADLPTTGNTVSATFADDMAILSANQDSLIASADLQKHINLLQKWFQNCA